MNKRVTVIPYSEDKIVLTRLSSGLWGLHTVEIDAINPDSRSAVEMINVMLTGQRSLSVMAVDTTAHETIIKTKVDTARIKDAVGFNTTLSAETFKSWLINQPETIDAKSAHILKNYYSEISSFTHAQGFAVCRNEPNGQNNINGGFVKDSKYRFTVVRRNGVDQYRLFSDDSGKFDLVSPITFKRFFAEAA